MKIVHVTLRFDAPGGVEANVRAVAGGLLAAGEDVEVFASDLYDESRWERRTGYAPSVDGVPVRRFPVVKRLVPGLTMPMMPGLIDALSGAHAQVIHAHSHRYGHVLQAAAVARERKIPLAVSTHYHPADLREPAFKRGLLRLQDVLFGSTAYRVASALVVETQLEARLLREFAPADRIRVIPPGVDLDVWRNGADVGVPPGTPQKFVLFAGRLASNKGLRVLLHAMAEWPQTDRLPLVVAGPDWGERPELERLAADLDLGGEIHWMGHVEGPQYQGLFRRAALLVLPSEWEAFGLVLLLAMASGCPIVATAVGGVPEVLEQGKCGRLVPYGDAKALARAMNEVAHQDHVARQLIEAGKVRVESFTWARAVERHRALYREIAA